MMTVLVTGSAGFIGSHVVERLRALGNTVVEYDRKTGQDILHGPQLDELPDVDAVIHLAALAGVRPSVEDPWGTYMTNVMGTQNVLDWAKRRGVERIVFASSSSVYGGAVLNPERGGMDVRPASPYAASKRMGELALHAHWHLYGASVVALRFFTVYGPRQRPDLAIRKFAERMLRGEAIDIYGDGDTLRDYTYITDVVDAVIEALAYTAWPGTNDIFNIGRGSPVQLRRVVELLERELGVEAKVNRLPMQKGDVYDTHADIRHAYHILDYDPKVSIEQGIKLFVQWLKEQT